MNKKKNKVYPQDEPDLRVKLAALQIYPLLQHSKARAETEALLQPDTSISFLSLRDSLIEFKKQEHNCLWLVNNFKPVAEIWGKKIEGKLEKKSKIFGIVYYPTLSQQLEKPMIDLDPFQKTGGTLYSDNQKLFPDISTFGDFLSANDRIQFAQLYKGNHTKVKLLDWKRRLSILTPKFKPKPYDLSFYSISGSSVYFLTAELEVRGFDLRKRVTHSVRNLKVILENYLASVDEAITIESLKFSGFRFELLENGHEYVILWGFYLINPVMIVFQKKQVGLRLATFELLGDFAKYIETIKILPLSMTKITGSLPSGENPTDAEPVLFVQGNYTAKIYQLKTWPELSYRPSTSPTCNLHHLITLPLK